MRFSCSFCHNATMCIINKTGVFISLLSPPYSVPSICRRRGTNLANNKCIHQYRSCHDAYIDDKFKQEEQKTREVQHPCHLNINATVTKHNHNTHHTHHTCAQKLNIEKKMNTKYLSSTRIAHLASCPHRVNSSFCIFMHAGVC